MSLKVIGAGFGRTGTFSLKLALEELGLGPCHHMYEIRERPDHVQRWLEISRGGQPDWDWLFEGFQSQVDWPASSYWRELMQVYPDAKVILTHRDPESWYASIMATIYPASEYGRHQDPDPVNRSASEMMYNVALQGIFEGRLHDRDFAIEKLLAHRQEVLDTVPSHRLLEYTPGEGWDRLCAFLERPVPETEFPRGNSVAEFRKRKPYLDDLPEPDAT